MKNHLARPLFVISIAIFALVGCQPSPSGPPAATEPEEVIVIHGDPMTLVEHTAMQPKSHIPKDFFSDGSSYLLFLVAYVRQSKMKTRESFSEIVEKAKAKKKPIDVSNDRYIFSANRRANEISFENSNFQFQMNLNSKDMWELKSASFLKPGFNVLHYSHNIKSGVWSLLVKESADVLSSFTLVPTKGVSSYYDGSSYISILGEGYPARWKDNLTMTFCHQDEDRFEDLVRTSTLTWAGILEDRFSLAMEKGKCPPFSDVNKVGIHLVDTYMIVPLKDRNVLGRAHVIGLGNRIYAGSIFIMRSEIYEKFGYGHSKKIAYGSEEGKNFLLGTITHEIGHILGLDHDMERASIMNYNYSGHTPTELDIEAIRHFYKE